MARLRIIILERDADSNTFRCALWADVPTARQPFYANPNAVSAWKDATTQDNDALKSGAVVETIIDQRVDKTAGMPQIQAFLQDRWNDYQTAITNRNPWNRYGSTWDGTTWVVVNNG